MDCSTAAVTVSPITAVHFNFLYWSFDFKQNGIRYKKINLDFLKSRWSIENANCIDQIQSFEIYDEDGKTLLVTNQNVTIIKKESEIGVTTEFFDKSSKIFLKNVQKYGANS
jgi:hypothetical protein